MAFPQTTEAADRNAFRGRRLNRIAVAVALAATAGGLNVVAGTPARAVDGAVWNQLAKCESGGNWHIETGNGYSGGLQFAASTWRAYGGRAYAARAAHASRAQQIAVAERVLRGQGWGAWPTCSARLHRPARPSAPRTLPAVPHRRHAAGPARHRASQPTVTHGRRGAGYRIRPGDTLSGIAAAHNMSWTELYRLNRHALGANPGLIYPGIRIVLRASGLN